MNSRFDEKKKTGHPTPLPNHAAYRTVPHVSSIKAPPPPFVKKKKLHQADTELTKKPKPKLVQSGPPISRYFPIVRHIFSFFFFSSPLADFLFFFPHSFFKKKPRLIVNAACNNSPKHPPPLSPHPKPPLHHPLPAYLSNTSETLSGVSNVISNRNLSKTPTVPRLISTTIARPCSKWLSKPS